MICRVVRPGLIDDWKAGASGPAAEGYLEISAWPIAANASIWLP